jgi:predicted amidohydrolase
MQNLTVGLVQAELHWEQAGRNRAHFDQLLDECAQQLDLIVLPEMFNTGFSMNAAGNAESMDGPSINWMLQKAEAKQAAVVGSLAIAVGKSVYNRLVFAQPDGTLQHYDKRHLFRMANEQDRYAAGKQRVVINYCSWRICPMVCYDLRFPVWSRNCNDYDMLLYVANWPARRREHWRQLLIARAIENQAAVIGVNRVGVDGNDVEYSGDSLAIDASGELLSDPRAVIGVHVCTLNGKAQQDYRQRFPAFMDADQFTLHV